MGDMTVASLIDGKKRRCDPELSVVEQGEDLEPNISE